MEAKFIRGNPEFARFLAGADIAAGEVVLVGDLICIAHSFIADATWGNLAIGGGIYECVCGEAIAVGKRVHWTANELSETGTDPIFGFLNLHLAADADQDLREALHRPYLDIDTT